MNNSFCEETEDGKNVDNKRFKEHNSFVVLSTTCSTTTANGEPAALFQLFLHTSWEINFLLCFPCHISKGAEMIDLVLSLLDINGRLN